MGYANNAATPFSSGRDGTWTPQILARARKTGIGLRLASFVSTHVEMKVAEMMIQQGRQHTELVINHVPCGSQPYQRYDGCDQVLGQYLPQGYTLTVYGTTQDGQPFSRTYPGTGRTR